MTRYLEIESENTVAFVHCIVCIDMQCMQSIQKVYRTFDILRHDILAYFVHPSHHTYQNHV